MDIDLPNLSADRRYKLLTALVIPRPIAWITSTNAGGLVNLAPYSFFNVLGNRPPVVAFGPSDRGPGVPKDTPRNIEETGEFVINLVHPECAELMHRSAAPFAADVSEVDALGLELTPSSTVKAPRLTVAKVALECSHHSTVEVGDNRIVLGLVQHLFVEDGIIDPETMRMNQKSFVAVGRMQGPGIYCTTEQILDLGPMPTPAQALAAGDPRS
jgi:flavin reductase (DIM6/NTAB) family NADH-FMN oxidoreductase RutF